MNTSKSSPQGFICSFPTDLARFTSNTSNRKLLVTFTLIYLTFPDFTRKRFQLNDQIFVKMVIYDIFTK